MARATAAADDVLDAPAPRANPKKRKVRNAAPAHDDIHESVHEHQDEDVHFDDEVHQKFPENWKPAAHLEAPKRRDGYVQRWIRTDLLGKNDQMNTRRQLANGWRPRSYSTVPAEQRVRFPKVKAGNGLEIIKTGDLVLCEMPVRLFNQMRAHFRGLSQGQVEALDENQIVTNANKSRAPGFGKIVVTRSHDVGVNKRRPSVAADELED